MDWVRLGSSNYDLAGTKGIIRPISYEELTKHDKIDDSWLAIRGKVYNVTKYMDFHPGGTYDKEIDVQSVQKFFLILVEKVSFSLFFVKQFGILYDIVKFWTKEQNEDERSTECDREAI